MTKETLKKEISFWAKKKKPIKLKQKPKVKPKKLKPEIVSKALR